MKLLSFLVLIAMLSFSCNTTKSGMTDSDGVNQEKILDQFNNEDAGNKIIYTNQDKEEKNRDIETSVDTHKKTTEMLYSSLADRLRKIGGLTVMGSGDRINVIVRGISSISLTNEPIYVIDGFNIGRSYSKANNAIDVNRIKSIRVLKGPAQTAAYGEEGNNGVILIKTIKDWIGGSRKFDNL